jgi:hypothetical protein
VVQQISAGEALSEVRVREVELVPYGLFLSSLLISWLVEEPVEPLVHLLMVHAGDFLTLCVLVLLEVVEAEELCFSGFQHHLVKI